MTIEEIRAKALQCAIKYLPDAPWNAPEFQRALKAFSSYILTGAWPDGETPP
jgi:hypothetical protein